MKKLQRAAKLFILLLTSFLSGIFIFLWVITILLDATIMDLNFHMKLFEKNDIYSEVQSEVSILFDNLSNDALKHSLFLDEDQKKMLYLLQGSISPQMIRENLDSTTEGLFKYFRAETSLLPDIKIDTGLQQDPPSLSQNDSDYILSKIKRISLSAILRSVNHSYITDYMLSIRLVYFISGFVQKISPFIYIALLFVALGLSKHLEEILKWIFRSLIFAGILNLLAAVLGFLLYLKFIPDNISNLAVFIPLKDEVILSYFLNCTLPISILCAACAVFIAFLSILTLYLNKIAIIRYLGSTLEARSSQRYFKTIKYTAVTLVLIFTLGVLSSQLHSFRKVFASNNFNSVVSRFTNANAHTEIIAAKDDTIYTLQIKLFDAKNKSPVSGIRIKATEEAGKTQNEYHALNAITDETGCAKFTLAKGPFWLEFSAAYGINKYILPSPFLFNLESVGTTIITFDLDQDKSGNNNTGIVEIEFLDEDNLHVKNIEVFVNNSDRTYENNETTSPKSTKTEKVPDVYASLTNEEGVAVLRLPEGFYDVEVQKDKFPPGYKMANPFEVRCSSDLTTRYTIRLVKETNTSP